MKKVLVVGSMNMDLVSIVDHLPKSGETILANNFETHHGGKGANQAVAIAKLGGYVSMMGIVGNDNYGQDILENLKLQNVDIDHVLTTDKANTGMANITVDKDGNNTIVVIPGANHEFDNEYILEIEKQILKTDIVVLQLEIPLKVVEYIINFAFDHKKIVVLNPAPAVKLNKELLSKISYLIVNESELAILSNTEKVDTFDESLKIAKEFKTKNNISNLIVTLGSKGSYSINENNEMLNFDSLKVKAVDTTGAGDSYLGAFIYGLSNNWMLKDSLQLATKVSAITVTKSGAQESIPTMIEIEKFNN